MEVTENTNIENKQGNQTLESLPDIINAQEIQEYLRLSKAAVYNLLRSKNFPTLMIGSRRLVMKRDFIMWLERHKNSTL